MKRNQKWIVTLTALIATGLGVSMIYAANELTPPTGEEIQKMEQAVPAHASVSPKSSRKILVFNRCDGYPHGSIPYVAQAIEIMGRKTGAFSTEQSTDMIAFNAANLKRFDAILLNNSTTLKFENDDQKQGLMSFVKGGKGLIGIHAATDNFYDWPEAAEMMGGLFNGHPWGSGGTWAFKIEDPDHPVMKAFGGRKFTLSDEIYHIKFPFSRRNLRVLLSLDLTDPMNLTPDNLGPNHYDAPVSWIRRYGKGRVFYCSLGHNKEVLWNPMILQHYLDGIQYALGDLEADATPSYVDWDYFEYSLNAMKDYDYGKNQLAINAVDQAVRDGGGVDSVRQRLEKSLIGFLQEPSSLAAKQFVCRQLRLIGSEASVGVLANMLTDEATSDMARYALQGNPSPAVDRAMLEALPSTQGKVKIGMINSLGARESRSTVTAISKLIYDSDPSIAEAAIAALGHIADAPACDILAEAVDKTAGELQVKACNSYLSCADRLVELGEKDHAQRIYEKMFSSSRPEVIRMAAIRGIILDHADPGSVILGLLKEEDPSIQSVALGLLSQLPNIKNLKSIATQYPHLAPAIQVQLLTALGNRGDRSVRDEVVQAARSEDSAVRMAALEAMANLGDDSAVILLAQAAADATSAEEQDIARRSLYSIRSPRADEIIINTIPTAETKVKKELIISVYKRNIVAAVGVLFDSAKDPDRSIRIESYRGLKRIAQKEHIPQMLGLLKGEQSGSVRKEAEYALRSACEHIQPTEKQPDPIIEALSQSEETAYRCSLINVLGHLERDEAMDTLRAAAKDDDQDVKKTAIMVLSEWENTQPMADLKKIATASKNPDAFRIPAALGYVRMIQMDEQATPDQKVELYREAMELWDYPKVKKLVLSGISKTASLAAIHFAAQYLSDEQLKPEAEAAIKKIVENHLKNLPEAARTTIITTLQE